MHRLVFALLLASSLTAPTWAQQTATPPDRAAAEPAFIAALAALYDGNAERAVTRLSDVLAMYPDDPVVLDVLAEAYLAQGLTAEALYHAELAASVAPDDATIQRRLADIYDASGDAVRAQQARETAQRLAPDTPRLSPSTSAPQPSPARTEPASDTELPGEAAYRAGRYAEAAEALLGVIDEDPRRIEAWPLALDALTRTSDARAGDTADLALLLFPTLPSILVPAAEALLSVGRTDDARSAAESALRSLDGATDDPALRQRADALLSSLR